MGKWLIFTVTGALVSGVPAFNYLFMSITIINLSVTDGGIKRTWIFGDTLLGMVWHLTSVKGVHYDLTA